MSKPQLVVTDRNAETIPQALGMSIERQAEVVKTVEAILKADTAEPDGKRAEIIAKVYNAFEDAGECAFALFILQHEEAEVVIHELFRLPEAVASSGM